MPHTSQQQRSEPVLTRRSFVRTAGAVAGAAAFTPFAQSSFAASAAADDRTITPTTRPRLPQTPFTISGVIPSLSVSADLQPKRTESGIGALVPWADRLWFVTYVAHKKGTGSGTGLFEVDSDFTIRKRPESVVGTYANRMVHTPSMQLIIGPHIIDTRRNVRTFAALQDHRLTATMTHLTNPQTMVYFLTMEGLLFEADVRTLDARQIFDLNRELDLPKDANAHYKGGFTAPDRLVVANNTYSEPDTQGTSTGGRLAEWTPKTNAWTVLERTAFCDVTGRRGRSHAEVLATGWDRASAILKVFAAGKWSTYRLPKASHCYDHMWYTEWPRIREVETERLLMDCHGMFYELSPLTYGGVLWGIKPVCQHLRMIPDFCTWRGLLVLAGDLVAALAGNELLVGEPQSNLWFGKTDDLWSFGKPAGSGGPWLDTPVRPDRPSDPYLMNGFANKSLHLYHDAPATVAFTVEVDFIGNQTYKTYDRLSVPAGRYVHHEFPPGFGAHWLRLTVDAPCAATAWLTYS